ncbi:MAG: prolyl oligopeptidase family serine peptidase [Patescibacteria group bacterium]|nr:prolyl oligopeptidase family serine peptidase [Patescibacteria group bacterium]
MENGKKKIIIGLRPFILGGLLVLFASGILIFVKGSNFSEGNSSDAEGRKNESEESMNENLDADDDGLPDRIEKNIGTNFEKNDTDGDGYADFTEVKNGYSPFVSGAEGKLSAEELEIMKEKIKNADKDLYEKIFGDIKNSILPDSLAASAVSLDLPIALSGPAVFKEEISLSNKNWKYSFYAPCDIDMNKEHSLLIGLHGFEGNAKDYIKFWQSDADKNGFLAAALQAYPKTYPSGSTVESYPWLEISDFTKAALADIKKKYKIDDNKIFLTGYSAGGSSAYIVALDSGIKFKGVVAIDGYLPLEAGILDKLSKARDVNFYVVHGANNEAADEAVNQEKILLQYGAKMEFKILPGLGHEYPAAEHENIVKWMNGLEIEKIDAKE